MYTNRYKKTNIYTHIYHTLNACGYSNEITSSSNGIQHTGHPRNDTSPNTPALSKSNSQVFIILGMFNMVNSNRFFSFLHIVMCDMTDWIDGMFEWMR